MQSLTILKFAYKIHFNYFIFNMSYHWTYEESSYNHFHSAFDSKAYLRSGVNEQHLNSHIGERRTIFGLWICL